MSVNGNSPGGKAGLRPGDELISINGQPVRDPVDLKFCESDEWLELVYRPQGGKRSVQVDIEKPFDRSLGLTLDEPRYRWCGNKCIFCFVDQMAPGLRPTLYVKDEDFRLSFLRGNYITLTNLFRKDINRILAQRLSPLYISVHTTDPRRRRRMLGASRGVGVMRAISRLIRGGIELHTQIVLCPGINDGQALDGTISDLTALYPGVQSVAVVPVGLTKHRQGLYPLKSVTAELSRLIIGRYKVIQKKLRDRHGKTILYFADELYLNAGLDIPSSMWYDDFPQLDNGVGMVRNFWSDFGLLASELPQRMTKRILLITGQTGIRVLRPVVARLNRIAGLQCEMLPVPNLLFGESVTVSGLLGGRDILSALSAKVGGYDLLALPDNALNGNAKFIDDISLTDFRRRVRPSRVTVGLGQLMEGIKNNRKGRPGSRRN